ncbi:hypothetical protein V8F06_010960 [Rhypophila decipiens]
MGSYSAVKISNWATPEGYDDGFSSLADPIPSPWDQPSSKSRQYQEGYDVGSSRSYQYRQPAPQSNSYFDDSDSVSQYPQRTRYGSSFNDPPSFLPDLTKSPSISSGSSIGTPSGGRSYQSITGSYFPPSRKNTNPYPINPLYQETDPRYPAVIDDDDNGLEHVGSRFSDMKLEDKYSGRMDAPLYENSGYEESREKPREPTKQERADMVKEEVDDIFDEAEATVTAQDWKRIDGPKPAIASSIKQAVRVLRESESINKDLKGIAATLAEYRRKRRHRPSFSGRKSSSTSKDVYFGRKDSTADRDRYRRRR